ncbi:IclR family transcriptional regulator [Streptomyces pseudovenezuelae]|uniref:IclR family transcriptional regulator n=1 Tax=Streptomyces pseudovenezuelae TaxID=67350 RepID=UPI002E7FC012|nr:IclR family transcriptional regulator [Streptomyces pseudovenezuelae]WUA93606.1 IclR family transcriptional regulator [Streptomyces pseudovenezuelae]
MTNPPSVSRGRRPAQGDPVIDRAFALLTAFNETRRAMTLAELSRVTDTPPSTTLRLARRLLHLGALERDADGRFVVGLRLWEVASLAPRAHGLRTVALPFMEDLYEATHQHVLFAVQDGMEALLVERLSAREAIDVLYRVGGRLPLHSTGVGLVLLAHAAPDFQEAYLAQPLVHEPEGVPLSSAALRRALAEVRRNGIAIVNRQEPRPLLAAAAPVRGADGDVVAALSVVVPAGHTESRFISPALRATARALSRGLGAPVSAALPPGRFPDRP